MPLGEAGAPLRAGEGNCGSFDPVGDEAPDVALDLAVHAPEAGGIALCGEVYGGDGLHVDAEAELGDGLAAEQLDVLVAVAQVVARPDGTVFFTADGLGGGEFQNAGVHVDLS
jgi:hypothetical protein